MPESRARSDSPDYELELERSALQRLARFLRTWAGKVLALILLLVLLGVWRGPSAYRAIKEWRMHSLLEQADTAQGEGRDSEAFHAIRKAQILVPNHLEVQRSVARYHSNRSEPVALPLRRQIVENGNATIEDEVALCQEALRWGVLIAVRERLQLWTTRADVAQHPGVLSIQAEIQALDGHSREAVRLGRAAVAAAEAQEDGALTRACRLTLARTLLQASGDDGEIMDGRREAMVLLRDLSLGTGLLMRDALEILVRLAVQPSAADLIRDAGFDAVISHASESPTLPASLKVAAWDLKLAGIDAGARHVVMEKFSSTYRTAEQTGALEAARWLNQHREYKRALELAGASMQTDESWFLVGMDALAAMDAWREVLERLDPARNPPLSPAIVQLFTFRAQRELGLEVDSAVVWRDVVARLHSESPAIQIYAAAYAEQLGYPVEATSIYRRFLTRTDSPSSRRDQPMERRKAYLGILRNSSQSMSLDDLTSLCSSIVEEFPDMDEARNDLHYLRLLQNKVDPTAAEEVDRLFYSHPQMLAVRSTLALTLLRQGRIQAAHEVYARCQIDWATAPDRYKAVRIAVLDAAGNFFQADQLRSTLNISNLRDEEMKLAGVEVLRAEVSTKR